ncbi:MAG TPA: hypothetical protein VMK05_13290 [Burkholderiales bacterium]|nr:hypothetical protein [Burkholderiales bacterium]
MLNILIVDEAVIEHGSLAADLFNLNGIVSTLGALDIKRMQRNLQSASRSQPVRHLLDRSYPAAA